MAKGLVSLRLAGEDPPLRDDTGHSLQENEKLVSSDIPDVRYMDRDLVLPRFMDDDRCRRHDGIRRLHNGHYFSIGRWQHARARVHSYLVAKRYESQCFFIHSLA